MECPQQAQLRRAFENALADIDRIIDNQAKALSSTEDATMVEISIAIGGETAQRKRCFTTW